MIKKLIVSHGEFAAHLVHAARRINAAPLGDVSVLCLEWDTSLERAREQVEEALRSIDRHDGILILTDVFGATPSNACIPLLEPGVIEMVTGVNLPMVMRLGTLQSQPENVSELAEWIRAKAEKSIVHLPQASATTGCNDREGARG